MKRLVNCLDKLVGKLITKADADFLVSEARSYEAEGLNPVEAERMAVADAIEQTDNNGSSVLDQIQQSVPQALPDAQEYWERESVRKVGAPFQKERRLAAPVEKVTPPAAPVAQPVVAPEAVTPEAVPVTPEAPVVTPEAPVVTPEAPPVTPVEAPVTPEPPAVEAVPEAKAQPILPGFREPLTTAQRAVVDSLPEAQRAKMEQAFQANPFPDPHTALPKKSPTILPERNKAIPELSKYGVLDPDATTQSVLENIAADKSLPKWMRTIMDLLVQVGNLDNVEIEAVYLPGSNWPALYANRKGTSKIYINLAKNLPPGGLPRTIAHEVLHHMTMMKLMDRVPLNDTEAEAKAELTRIFEHIQGLPEFADEYGARNPWEFASDVFSSESLRAKLNALTLPGSKLTLMQQIRRLLAALGFGGKEIRAGSMLEEAMRQTIKVAGTTAVTGEGTAAMSQGARARFMRVMNEFPQFQNELINATAPIEFDMEITAEERKKDWESAHYTDEERLVMNKSLDEALAAKGWKLTPQERAKWDDKIEKRVKGTKALSPQSEGWAQHLIHPSKIILTENKKGERGAKVEWVKAPYTFDQEKGKGLKTGSTEWNQRAEDLATRGVEDLQTRIMVGEDPLATPEEKKAARVILDQIGWYRSVMDHIRHSYGGMSDMFADLLGTFSPQTQVKQNWEYGIQALKKTMEGDYDELLSRVDKWMKEDPTRTIDDWKALHKANPEKAMILKENDKLFGQNSIHGMKALLDFWRIVQTGSAPKARNFTANLIGHSYKATIDLWAARFLQRMHLPNFRIPTIVEGDVTGAHMKDVEQISGQFGLGQEVFRRMAEKLKAENPTVWGEVSPADLQAIMWYGEKHVWETKNWTRILGASNSMKAMAEAEAVNRYELGLSRDRTEKRVTAKDQRTHGMKLRNNLSGIAHTVGAKVMDTVSMFQGTKERAWDSEILVYPEYDPQEMVDYVVEVAGTSNQDATHISRVIDTEFEKDNPNARPGITVFFREQVDLAAVQPVMAELERLGINGFTLQVDSRAKAELRPEVMKKGVPDRFFGVRMQFVPEYFSTEQEAAEALPEILIGIAEAKNALQNMPNVAYINEVHYDTLVLKKGEYDTTGKLRDPAAISRAEVWRERARSVGREAATRRDAVREQIRKTDAEAKRLKREADRAEEERIAELSGGVPEEVTAAQAQESEKEAALTRRFIGRDDDEFWGITENEELGGASFPDGRSAVECTGYSKAIQRKLGVDRVKLFGFFQDDNPTSEIAQLAGGHDFAVVDDRYIVDPWITDVESISDKGVFDLQDPDDQEQIKRLYGDQSKWERGVIEEPPTTAAQAQEYEEPIIDPVSGRPSLVRALALAEANAGGTVFPKGSFPRPGVRSAGSRAGAGGVGTPSVWQTLGDAFRRTEGEVHRGFQRAGEELQLLNPGREKRYERSQALFDYLSNPDREVTDPELEGEINALRERIPVIAPGAFDNFRQLQRGQEATVFHDEDGKVVYKIYPVNDGKMKGYVPGNIVRRSDGSIAIEMGKKPSFEEFLARVDNVNNHGKLTPMELVGVMQDGHAVFAQPFVRGQRVKSDKIEEALRRLGMKMLSDIGGIAAIGKVGDKYVLFDDLHEENVRLLPGKRTEIIDAINRDLTQDEVDDLRKLDKLPDDVITAPQEQEVKPRGGFFSGVAKILSRKMPNAAPAQQVKAIIRDAPQEDIKWSGVNQEIDRLAAENNGKVPKGELLNYLQNDGAVRLEEHRLPAEKPPTAAAETKIHSVDDAIRFLGAGYRLTPYEVKEQWGYSDPNDYINLARRLEEQQNQRRPPEQTGPKFAQYTIPGGENYREVVLAMPGQDEAGKRAREEEIHEQYERGEITRSQRLALLEKNYKGEGGYTSSHFPDVPNYVAHARMNDRVDAEGKPGLFLEEIQSDRHQAGREKGYAGDFDTSKWKVEREIPIPDRWNPDAAPVYRVFDEKGHLVTRPFPVGNLSEAQAIEVASVAVREKDRDRIADAPFRKDWPVQMFKRALRDAIAQGKEWIGWTTGDIQAERYDLSKQVDKILVQRNAAQSSGKYFVKVFKDGELIHSQNAEDDSRLADMIGKDLAAKAAEEVTEPGLGKTYSGLDLKVGGEGMRGFYDKMLPGEIGKYVKQWGGKVEQDSLTRPKAEIRPTKTPGGQDGFAIYVGNEITSSVMNRKQAEESLARYRVAEGGDRYVVRPSYNRWEVVNVEDDASAGTYGTQALAQEAADASNKARPPEEAPKIWKVEITPQMKETIPQKGQSLFGAVAPQQQEEWFGDSKVVNPDGTPMTMYHGTIHKFKEFLGKRGFYFSNNKEYAAGYGERGAEMEEGTKSRLYSVHLSIQNPLELSGEDTESWERYTQHELDREDLIKQGYDGVIMRYADGEVEAMAFYPEQISPATKRSPLKRRYDEPVQDGTDVVSSPLSPRGHLTRILSFVTGVKEQDGYRTEGYWKAAGGFNDLIWEAMKTKVQNGKSLIANASFLNNEYLKIVNKVYGKAGPNKAQQRVINLALGNIENRLKKWQSVEANRIRDPKLRADYLDQKERDNITEYKAEQQDALNSLPVELRALIVKKNDLIVQMNNALLANADLSPDLKEAIDKNKGTYLHRSYEIFEDNDRWKKWITNEANPEAVRRVAAARTMIEGDILNRKVIEYATGELKKGKPVTRSAAYAHVRALPGVDQEVTNELNSYLNIGDNPGLGAISLLGGARPGAKGLAIMTERGMIRKEIQDLWGTWEDPAENFVKTYVSTGYFIENSNFQRQVLEDGLAAGYIYNGPPGGQPVGWVPIVPEGSRTMDILAGAYGPPLLREAFDVMNSPVNKAAIQGLLTKITSWPLAMKTKFSTASTARNFLGNIWFVISNDNIRRSGFKSAGKTAFAEAVHKGGDTLRSYVKELTALGVLGENVNTEMLKEMTEFAQKNNPLTKEIAKGYSMIPDFARKAWEKYSSVHGAAYSGVDSFWKVYAYEGELAKLTHAWAGVPSAPSEAELKKEAANIVRRTMPTYSEAWSGLKHLSGPLRLVAPFIKFQTEVIRTSIGTVKQGLEEFKSTNPKIRKAGVRRVALSSLMMTTAPAVMALATRALFGYDDDQEEALRASLPDWQKNATMFFLPKDDKGNAQFLDLSYMNPYKVYSNPITALLRAVTSGKEGAIVEAGASSIAEFFRPFLAEQLWASAVIDIHRNQDSQKNYGPLYNEQDTTANKATAIAKRFMTTMSPGDWDTMLRVKSGLTGEVSGSGKEYKAGNELMAIAGFRKTTYDTAQGLQSLTARFEGDKSDAQKLLLGPLTNRGSVNPQDVASGYEQANKQRKNLYYKMRQNYLASQKLGLTETQAISAMMIGYGSEARKTGIGKADLQSIAGGQYFRYTPSKAALAEAAAKNPDRYEAFLKAYNAAPVWEDISD